MNKALANKALAAVNRKHATWIRMSKADGITDADCYPQLIENYYGGMDHPAPYAIAWECNSPDNWAIMAELDVPGVALEPIYSFVLGVYDA